MWTFTEDLRHEVCSEAQNLIQLWKSSEKISMNLGMDTVPPKKDIYLDLRIALKGNVDPEQPS